MNIHIKNADKITLKGAHDIFEIMRLILKRNAKIDRTKEQFWTIAISIAGKIGSVICVNISLKYFQ